MTPLVLALVTGAAVLLVSGIAKLRDPDATADAFPALRLPGWLVRAHAPAVLPWAEIALGAVLLVSSGPLLVAASLATLALFAAYLVVVARARAFDEPVRCSCFGVIGDDTVTGRTVVRNVVLVLIALLALAGAFAGVSLPRALVTDSAVGPWLAVAGLTFAVGMLIGGGGPSTPEATHGVRGRWGYTLADAGTGERVPTGALGGHVLLFLSPGCGPCQRLAPDVPAWHDALPGLRPVFTDTAPYESWGSPEARRGTLLDPAGNVAIALTGGPTPAAVLLDDAGTPAETVVGETDVRSLLDRLTRPPAPDGTPDSGDEPDPAPVVEEYRRRPLPWSVVLAPDGEPLTLHQLVAQQPALLVGFEEAEPSAASGPAADLVGRLDAWAAALPAVRVALLSTTPHAALPAGVRPRALHDHAAIASRALRLEGTGSAVLLGADGLLAGGPVPADEAEAFVADIAAALTGDAA